MSPVGTRPPTRPLLFLPRDGAAGRVDACGLSRVDWLARLDLRAYALGCNEQLSVGRVRTPTLSMLVERELNLAIRALVRKNCLNVVYSVKKRRNKSPSGR